MSKINNKNIDMRIIVLTLGLAFLSICSECSAQTISKIKSSQTDWSKQDGCKYFLYKISKFWKMDSLGQTGLREFSYTELISVCAFEGRSWKEVEKILGKPNSSRDGIASLVYKYQASPSNGEWYNKASIVFFVDHKTGLIKRIKRQYDN